MATHRDIASTETDPLAPIVAALMKAFAGNLPAALEAVSNAPVNQTHWHPYDKVTNGDANTGLIYDFAVSGAVANVPTPNFVDGYEYRLIYDGISGSGTGVDFTIALYRETDAAYGTAMVLFNNLTSGSTKNHSGQIVINRPRRVQVGCLIEFASGLTSAVGSAENVVGAAVCSRAAQKRLRGLLAWSSGNIDAGKIFMERRRYIG